MPEAVDLAGSTVDGWTVTVKAPAQKRVRFWTCVHEACGQSADLPHVSLVKAIAGKGGLPRCVQCAPHGPNIDHGMHLACGSMHLLGAPCPDGIQREPGPNTVGRLPATTQDFPTAVTPMTATACAEPDLPGPVPHTSPTWALGDLGHEGAVVVEINGADVAKNVAAIYTGHPAQHEPGSAYQKAKADVPRIIAPPPADAPQDIEPEPAARLADASTGDLTVHGRVDRLEAPQDALDVIRRAMAAQERNLQSEPGPSQFGGCERRLGHHLATGIGNGNTDDGAWRPQVGTAVHAWLDEVFHEDNKLSDRWLTSYRVTNPVAGTIDIADTHRRIAIDFKITGKTTRDKAARGQVSEKYEVQLDLYALGLINDGYAIETVALLLLPASGSLSESVWYERPVNLDRAREAVARRDRINAMLSVAPIERVLEALSTTEDYCGSCAAFGTHCAGAAIVAPTSAPALRMVGGAA